MKRFFRFGISLLILSAFILLFGAVEKVRGDERCRRLKVKVDHSSGVYFLHKDDIRQFLKDRNDSLIGRRKASIELRELEAELGRIPAVKDAEVYHRLDGTLRVRVRQRKPIARFIDENGLNYYWDREGERMPLSEGYTPRVPVVTGKFDDPLSEGEEDGEAKKERFHRFLVRIRNDPFWNKQLQEIHFNAGGDVEMVPLVGDHRVIFGKLEDAEKKLKKLKVFYREASEHTGLSLYDTLDLRYGDQVVGKKKDHGGR